MFVVTEPILIVVGFGTGAFLLAATRVMGSAAERRIEAHMVQVKAMQMRNDYIRQLQAVAPPKPGGRATADEALGNAA